MTNPAAASLIQLIGTLTIRLSILLAPYMARWQDFGLRDRQLDEAKEAARAMSTRALLFSFAPLSLVLTVSESRVSCRSGLDQSGTLLLILACLVLCTLSILLPSSSLRGRTAPLIASASVFILDFIFRYALLKPIAATICASAP